MRKPEKFKQQLDKIIYTVLVVVLLCSVIVSMFAYVYKFSENQAFEQLRIETQRIKDNINLQMFSDRENLITMSNFASKLYTDGEEFDLIFKSFEEFGLIKNIGILLPDNRFKTKVGTIDVTGKISFEDEVKRGEYVSGRVEDLTNDKAEVVRSAVPVKTDDGRVVAIIYGLISLDNIEEMYKAQAAAVDAQLYIIEGGNGNYIIDTTTEEYGNITSMISASYKKGYSYKQIIDDLSDGNSGYTAYISRNSDGYAYAHYAPLDFADWQIMLMQPEVIVFSGAKATSNFFALIAVIIILMMIIYIALVFFSDRKKLKNSLVASNIRKNLLEINQDLNKIYDALEKMTYFAKSRSTFIIDTYNEVYYYIIPALSDKQLEGDDKKYFNSKLLMYAARHRKEHGAALYISKINAGKKLKEEMPEFYDFLKNHDIQKVYYAVVISNNSNSHVLGVINPRRIYITELLREVAVCFAMAIHNKKHLTRTEDLALTDSLTGVKNRLAYKQDIKNMVIKDTKQFACIYIDVNELHHFNNKNGHAVGDQMLVFIAQILKEEFSDCSVYRLGGDEFLIFVNGISSDVVKQRILNANTKIEEMKYNISIGLKYNNENLSIEELVTCAEKFMYEEKTKYYQNKGLER